MLNSISWTEHAQRSQAVGGWSSGVRQHKRSGARLAWTVCGLRAGGHWNVVGNRDQTLGM